VWVRMIDPSKPFCSCKFRRPNIFRDFWKLFEVRYAVHLLQIASECIGGGESATDAHDWSAQDRTHHPAPRNPSLYPFNCQHKEHASP
jgi:hypothetical protein